MQQTELQPAKIFIATPCFGGMVTQEYMESIMLAPVCFRFP